MGLQPGNHHPPSAELRQLHDELRPARDDFLGRCGGCAGDVVTNDEFTWLSGDLFHVDCVEQRRREDGRIRLVRRGP